jgi:site-specific DNA-methyltransferase (adenine-specific)
MDITVREDLPGQVYRCDYLEFLRALPAESVDLVLTDPPFPSLEIHREKGTTTRLKESKGSSNPWFSVLAWEAFEVLFAEVFRILKKDRHFFLWCDETTADVIKAQQEISDPRICRLKDGRRKTKTGFYFWREWIWVKTTQDGSKLHGGAGYHGRGANERILFFEKGKRALNHDILDVIPAPRVLSPRGERLPAPKPPKVTREVISVSTQPGELVVDPFCGTGVVGIEAMKLGRKFLLADVTSDFLNEGVRGLVMREERS